MGNRNKRVFTSILIILFSILFASEIDSQSGEEKSIVSIPFIQPASAHVPDVSLTGVGTATIDGVLSPGEWDGADQIPVFTEDFAGSTFFVMNDAKNLYLALEVVDSTLTPGDRMAVRFDNTHDGVNTDEDDGLSASQTGLVDTHFLTGSGYGYADSLQYGIGAVGSTGSKNFIEASKPLKSGDSNDFSLSFGDIVGFCLRYFNDGTSSTWTTFPVPPPPSPFSHIGCVGGAAQQSLYGHIVIAYSEVIPSTAEPASSSKSVYGELKVEKENYEIPYSGTTQVKMFGTVDSSTRGNKITITMTNPEGDREELSLIPSKNGYFENYFLFDRNSLLGIYEVSAFTYEGSSIGKISFQLYDKNNPIVSTTKEPEPAPEPVEAPASTGPQTVYVSVPAGTSVPGCEETNECFMPSSISINVGDTVTWTNDEDAIHSITSGTVSPSPDLTYIVSPDGRGVTVASGSVGVSPDGIFDGMLWSEGDTFSVTFDKEGTYPYYSNPWQAGCVIVGGGDTICPAPEPAPETAPFPSTSDMEDIFSSFLDTQVCEEFLSVDEVKTAIGYAGELTPFSIRFPPNPQMPGLEYMCTNSFSKSLAMGSSNLAVVVFVYDSAEPAIETFTVMSQNMTESSPSEIIEGVSETDWKYISAIIEEDPSKGFVITSQKDRHVTVIGSTYSDFEPLADLPQLHEVAKIVWEKIDKNISTVSEAVKEIVPSWIKNNAKWWSEGTIGEKDFVGGIQYLIKEKIIDIPDLPEQASTIAEQEIPDWIKNNAGWWADGLISEDEFVNGIKFLVEKGIIKV